MISAEKKSILVIDDEVFNLRLLTHMLSPEYTVYAIKDGQAGIEIAKERRPDLILLDIIMPEMNGYEVLAVLKASAETKNIPVIITSGIDTEEEKEKELLSQAAGCIHKPFDTDTVKAKVRSQMCSQMQIV